MPGTITPVTNIPSIYPNPSPDPVKIIVGVIVAALLF